MALLTRLELVQKALIACNEQEVSAIGETVESDMAASILDSVYDKLLHDFPWPHLYERRGTLEVTAVANKMKIPSQVMSLERIRYNGNDVDYLDPYDFEKLIDSRDTAQSNVDSNGAINDRDPRYWTTYDDEYVFFDSYNSSLVAANSSCYYAKMPAKMSNDTDYPDCPERFVSVLLDGLIAESFIQLKADPNMAAFYHRNYKDGVSSLKRWARRYNKKPTTYVNDYGRRRLS